MENNLIFWPNPEVIDGADNWTKPEAKPEFSLALPVPTAGTRPRRKIRQDNEDERNVSFGKVDVVPYALLRRSLDQTDEFFGGEARDHFPDLGEMPSPVTPKGLAEL